MLSGMAAAAPRQRTLSKKPHRKIASAATLIKFAAGMERQHPAPGGFPMNCGVIANLHANLRVACRCKQWEHETPALARMSDHLCLENGAEWRSALFWKWLLVRQLNMLKSSPRRGPCGNSRGRRAWWLIHDTFDCRIYKDSVGCDPCVHLPGRRWFDTRRLFLTAEFTRPRMLCLCVSRIAIAPLHRTVDRTTPMESPAGFFRYNSPAVIFVGERSGISGSRRRRIAHNRSGKRTIKGTTALWRDLQA